MTAGLETKQLYICRACGLIYDEEKGDPDSGIAPGTRFEDIPDDWECPLCGVTKTDFEPFEPFEGPDVGEVLGFNGGVVVVGAGIAGWSVVRAIRSIDSTIPVLMITACSGDTYHKPQLSVAIGQDTDRASLVTTVGRDQAKEFGISLLADTFVIGIDSTTRRVRTTRGTYTYTACVIAAGARPFRPPALAGAALFTVNHIDDWERLSVMIANSVQTRAVVIGGGLIGCELAENLVSKCQSVTVIEKQDLPLSSLIPEKAGQRLLEHLTDIDVNFLGSSTVTHVVEGDGCSTVCLEDGTTLEADLIILATGLVTDQRIAKSADLRFNNGLIVDSKTLETSQKGIYALGDCIAFEGRPSRYVEPIIKQAKAIAHAILGKAAPYEHREPIVRVKTPKLPITIEGLVQPEAAWVTKVDTETLLVMEQADSSSKSKVSIGR